MIIEMEVEPDVNGICEVIERDGYLLLSPICGFLLTTEDAEDRRGVRIRKAPRSLFFSLSSVNLRVLCG